MVIKEGRITEGIMTRIIKDFGTVLIMDFVGKQTICSIFNSKLILEKKNWKNEKKIPNILQFKSNRIKKIFLEVKEF